MFDFMRKTKETKLEGYKYSLGQFVYHTQWPSHRLESGYIQGIIITDKGFNYVIAEKQDKEYGPILKERQGAVFRPESNVYDDKKKILADIERAVRKEAQESVERTCASLRSRNA